jgi:hypothetical protein
VVDDIYKRANSEDHYVKCYLGSSPRLKLHCTVRVWKAGLINERAKVVAGGEESKVPVVALRASKDTARCRGREHPIWPFSCQLEHIRSELFLTVTP